MDCFREGVGRNMKKELLLIGAIFFLGALFTQIQIKNDDWAIGAIFNAGIFFLGIRKIISKKKIGDFKVIIFLAGYAFAIESIGIITGFPYGKFEYGGLLGPKIFEIVPMMMPLSYIPLVLGAVEITRKMKIEKHQILIATLILLIFDIVIDPGATKIGFWNWEEEGEYYGVPYMNFFGWIISGIIATAIASKIDDTEGAEIGGLMQISFWSGFAIISGIYISGLIGIVMIWLIEKQKIKSLG